MPRFKLPASVRWLQPRCDTNLPLQELAYRELTLGIDALVVDEAIEVASSLLSALYGHTSTVRIERDDVSIETGRSQLAEWAIERWTGPAR